VTVNKAAVVFLEGAETGTIKTRSGSLYKPSVVGSYRTSLNRHVLPTLGFLKLADVTTVDVQDLVDSLSAAGLNGSTVRNAIVPLRAIYRRAVQRGEAVLNPTAGVGLPEHVAREKRIASPEEAEALLAALPDEDDRALWACALYAGLRRGELGALRWEDVDFKTGIIHVRRSFDYVNRVEVPPKSKKGRRKVPLLPELRRPLAELKLRSRRDENDLVFGSKPRLPFNPHSVVKRADYAWASRKLRRLELHEARHTFASILIAAGVKPKSLATYMGHASIQTTYDLYGHLLEGQEADDAELVSHFLGHFRASQGQN
jgi:integrase